MLTVRRKCNFQNETTEEFMQVIFKFNFLIEIVFYICLQQVQLVTKKGFSCLRNERKNVRHGSAGKKSRVQKENDIWKRIRMED